MLTLNWNIIWTFVNIIVLFVLLKIFLFAPVLKVLNQREEMINNQLASAKNKEAEADNKLLMAQKKVDESEEVAKQKAQLILDMAEKKEKEYIKASKTEANRIIDEARRKAQKDKEELIANTKEEIISVALLAAKKVVAKNIDENQEKALFDDLIKKVGDA